MRGRCWAGFFLGGLLALAGCVRAVVPAESDGGGDAGPCGGLTRRVDEYAISGSNQIDVLLVVDDSAGSTTLLQNMQVNMGALFGLLANPSGAPTLVRPDFHVAVAPTSLVGLLKPLNNQAGQPSTCNGCRYLARSQCQDGQCTNLAAAVGDLLTVAEDPNQQGGQLIQTLFAALGVVVNPAQVSPTLDPPAVNAGFYRPDAGLAVLFVSAVPDRSLRDAAHYTSVLRTLRNLKGLGKEDNLVMVNITAAELPNLQNVFSAVAGGCGFDAPTNQAQVSSFCQQMRSALDGCASTQAEYAAECKTGSVLGAAARNQMGLEPFGTPLVGCQNDARGYGVQADPLLLALTCDLDGVIYNACANDWTGLLEGRFSAFLNQEPRFRLQQLPAQMRSTRAGCPSQDGTLCVQVFSPDGRQEFRDGLDVSVNGGVATLTLDRVLTGSRVEVHYDVATGTAQCCAQGCAPGEVCNTSGYCQAASCEGFTTCPADALCDMVTQKCIPATNCTRNEHCPTSMECDCATNACALR